MNPTRLTAEAGVTAAGVFAIDGSLFLALAKPDQRYSIAAGMARSSWIMRVPWMLDR